jgi:hypothetical protein
MLIRSFAPNIELERNEYADCGILEYKRHIYVFVDPNEYDNNTVKKAMCAILNQSVYKGNKEGTIVRIPVDNSVLIKTSLYFCNMRYEIPGNIKSSQIDVTSAYSKESQTMFESNQVVDYFAGHYSHVFDSDPEIYNEIENNFETTVLPPNYYNEMQQYKATSDLFTLGGSYIDFYTWNDIVDKKTIVEFVDVNLWDTMRLFFLGALWRLEDEAHGTFDLADLIHSSFVNYIGNDSYFIYDSDARGINKPGVNVVEGRVPLAKWYVPQHISNNVDTALSLFESGCHDLENKFGHIRVNCYTDKIGDKIKIKFKDYNTRPNDIKLVGSVSEEGDHISVDTGYHIEKAARDALDQIMEDVQTQSTYYK